MSKGRDNRSATSPTDSGPGNHQSETREQSGHGGVQTPSISLPKGGGGIKGIGEKFAANPVNGTGAMTVPIATSPGRSGFGPQLTLSYDSGSGNGPFGFGWSLSLPAITRKTDKGLPTYSDAEESDVYLISGSEDLVPVLEPDGSRFEDGTSVPDITIHRYRPRIEGGFARVERWTNRTTGRVHWRSISRENVTAIYGQAADSCIADPNDPNRIFSWLICESYDDKGNAIVYEFAKENDVNVDRGLANERNRIRTANLYVKRIKYGNRTSRLIERDLTQADWMFEVVFDYDESHYSELELDPARPTADQHQLVRASASSLETPTWKTRPDPFSNHRAGFEVRTYRRCRRILMFHHFPELGPQHYLVRSTEFDYDDLDYSQQISIETELSHHGSTRFASFIRSATQSGFVRDENRPLTDIDGVTYVTYLKKSLPALEFEYSEAVIQDEIRELDDSSLENLPVGLGTKYQWVDIDGEGVSGILTEQAGAWFYKPNLGAGRFGALQAVLSKPSRADLSGNQQLIDLAGDGQLDLVAFAGASPGFYERTHDETWESFKVFRQLPVLEWTDPNLRFVDLNGDGHADVLVTDDEVLTWYPSLGEEGFESVRQVRKPFDEEEGLRLVLNDATQSIYLADMCGDGLTDLVRIRNGEVCYWPNLGYGRFGAKVTMDNAPFFDTPDQFNHQSVRLADIDGSGVNDLIYMGRDGVLLYFNQSGNSWSAARRLTQFPETDNFSSVMVTDLLGNGTVCLVWSSPAPAQVSRPMRYIDLMGGQKPHLLIRSINNLGAETHVHYSASTKFYLADKLAGKPWITKIPFPVHVVERVETHDRISGNRFVTRYAYHHGYFDGVEREFRGFGLVEQWDTEEFAALSAGGELPSGTNFDESSHVPPVLTRSWFHTGAYLGRDQVSNFFAGLLDADDTGEYYREPGLTDEQARQLLLDDTVLPDGLTIDEERDACRALKGSMLRQEVFARDGTAKEPHPYSVCEQNFTIELVQPKGENRHGVFFTHPRESIVYHYDRNPADPRTIHELTLEVDKFGNVLKSAAVGYGRRQPDLDLEQRDQAEQSELLITYSEHDVTNNVDASDDYRTPLPSEARTFELTGLVLPPAQQRFTSEEMLNAGTSALIIDYEVKATLGALQKRLIEQVRTLYRRNDLAGPLSLGELQSLALPFENYKLAFTPAMVTEVYADRVTNSMLETEGRYVHSEGDANWWIPSGRVFFSPNSADSPAQELENARRHFFRPRRYRDAFHTNEISTESFVAYDSYDLLNQETVDAMGNRVTVGERDAAGVLTKPGNNYRVLQPGLVMDPNHNCTAVAFDALGYAVGTALMGKPLPAIVQGDSLEGFEANLSEASMLDHLMDPLVNPQAIIRRATTRFVYDLFAFERTKSLPQPQPATVYSLVRETHDADLSEGQETKIQLGFSYSDGFGREIQTKIEAEPGPVARRDENKNVIKGADGQPEMTPTAVAPRWVSSGWTVFNNKGKPVRSYEPFFTDTHIFEFDVRLGSSPVLFYDPLERVVATLYPNHTCEKVIFDPWRQTTWDVSDMVLVADPADDPDVGNFFQRLTPTEYLPGWHSQRESGSLGPEEQSAARQAAVHAATPTIEYADSLGRTFLTVAHNKFKYSNTLPDNPPVDQIYRTRSVFDFEGNQRELIDAKDRVVMHFDYDIIGNRIHQSSMEAGERWVFNDVSGKPLYSWDSRLNQFRTGYDALRRSTLSFQKVDAGPELVVGRTDYGESVPNAEANNLRGRMVRLFDQAGIVFTSEYDFKGNLLSSKRQFAEEYKATVEWSVVDAVPVESSTYTSRTLYDALNRPTQLLAPDNSVIRPRYNEANLLDRVDVNLRGSSLNGQPEWTAVVTDIDYDAKGQRELIEYGNGVRTTYKYDPLTSRVVQVLTQRNVAAFPDDCPQPPPDGWPGCHVQNLHYTYDPSGNVTHIRDDAQQTRIFRNKRVDPDAEYTYDAVYRLIEATGREHLGQVGSPPAPATANDDIRMGVLFSASDGNAVGRYLERYSYDEVGNLREMAHQGTDPTNPGWSRAYSYLEASGLEIGKTNNRLSRTTVAATTETYTYNGSAGLHGNMTSMPHLPLMLWNHRDQLQATARQVVTNGGSPETTWYVYSAGGQRVRKVTDRQSDPGVAPMRKKERLYLGDFEIYREYQSDGVTIEMERETLHIMDDERRVALVETRTQGDDGSPPQLIRYQFGNHLGSVSLELDHQAQIISYEEYTPFGVTSYQAVRNQTEAPKRYRYTGRERDEESGLYYHGARYYAGWLGRWVASDPAGLVDGPNLYWSFRDNPANLVDPNGTRPPDPSDPIEAEQFSGNPEIGRAVQQEMLVAQGKKKPGPDALEIAARLHGETEGTLQTTQQEMNELLDSINAGQPMGRVWNIDQWFPEKAFKEREDRVLEFAEAGLAAKDRTKYYHSTVLAKAIESGLIRNEADQERFLQISEAERQNTIYKWAFRRAAEMVLSIAPGGSGAGSFLAKAPGSTSAALKGLNAVARKSGLGGRYENVAEYMSDVAMMYQEYVTGVKAGTVYKLNGVKFDALDTARHILVDAKGPGYGRWVDPKTLEFSSKFKGREALVEEAERQLDASIDMKLEWVFFEPEVKVATETLLRQHLTASEFRRFRFQTKQ